MTLLVADPGIQAEQAFEALMSVSQRFSPDGQFIVSAGRDNKLILWKSPWHSFVPLEDLVEDSCNLVSGYLENNPNMKERSGESSEGENFESLCRDLEKMF